MNHASNSFAASFATALMLLTLDVSGQPNGLPSHSPITPGGSNTNPAASQNDSVRATHETISLNGTWSVTPLPLAAEGEVGYKLLSQTNAERFAAHVPGEIHLDLMNAGRMEDPDISDNARERC